MKKFAMQLWQDEAGFVVSSELILISTIAVLGLITALATVRDQVTTELADVADALSVVNQSFSWSAVTAHSSSVAGSVFDDAADFCDTATDGAQGLGAGTCTNLEVAATDE
ncbi:MAG: hypothetical protein KatS3mg113_0950 [Planctomycetaceae bacterium]|nr:MAG: hypothetical protein KatS3mg113_0950 [Planctomycetaceae bacterium]